MFSFENLTGNQRHENKKQKLKYSTTNQNFGIFHNLQIKRDCQYLFGILGYMTNKTKINEIRKTSILINCQFFFFQISWRRIYNPHKKIESPSRIEVISDGDSCELPTKGFRGQKDVRHQYQSYMEDQSTNGFRYIGRVFQKQYQP